MKDRVWRFHCIYSCTYHLDNTMSVRSSHTPPLSILLWMLCDSLSPTASFFLGLKSCLLDLYLGES